jgi:hypothetical protein
MLHASSARNAELLKLIPADSKTWTKKIPSEETDDDFWSRGGDGRGGKLLDRRYPTIF